MEEIMEIKVFKVNSIDELDDVLKNIKESSEKDIKIACEEDNERYDLFIDLIIDLSLCVSDSKQFAIDSEVFRKYLHEAPLHIKSSFYKNFSIMFDEIEKDIMGLTAECAILKNISKKSSSNDKEQNEKGKYILTKEKKRKL